MKRAFSFLAITTTFLVSIVQESDAQKLCLKISQNSRTKKISISKVLRATCPRGYSELLNTGTLVGATGPTGATGNTGPAGLDGETAVYGTGELGDLVVTTGTTTSLLGTAQHANCTVQSGATLQVESGTILRCTGTFTNDGTVTVFSSRNRGSFSFSSNAASGALVPPSSGVALTTAGSPEYSTSGAFNGGKGGTGLGASSYPEGTIVRAPNGQGGGGGAAGHGQSTVGGHGGGWFAIYAVGAISVGATGSVTATGDDGGSCSGGGGGGIVVLASKTSVSVSGTIDVSGGDGGASTVNCGAGGGGGGGMVMSISPTTSVPSGSVLVNGGSAGTGAAPSTPASGGGGGGASRGNGGDGQGSATSPTSGSSGSNATTSADPTSIILG